MIKIKENEKYKVKINLNNLQLKVLKSQNLILVKSLKTNQLKKNIDYEANILSFF